MSKDTKHEDKLIEQIITIAKTLDCNFTVKGESIAIEKVFSKQGLLAAFFRRADQLCSFCLGYGLGVTFERSDSSMTGVVVIFDTKVANSLRLLCFTDVLIEIMQQAPSLDVTPLDEMMSF